MELGEAVRAAVFGPQPADDWTGQQLAEQVGGARGIREVFAGRAVPPKHAEFDDPASFELARREFLAAKRRGERYTTTAGQRRGRSARLRLTPAQQVRAWGLMVRRRGIAFRRSGGRARMRAVVRVSSDVRTRTMPAAGPGELIKRGRIGAVLDDLAADRLEVAGARFADAFMRAYFGTPDDSVPEGSIESIEWLKLWPATWPEPLDNERVTL